MRMLFTNEIHKQFEEIVKVESLITSVDNEYHCLILTPLTLTMKMFQKKTIIDIRVSLTAVSI